MITAGVGGDEIDHIPKSDAVGKIPGDAGQQQSAGPQVPIIIPRSSQEIKKHSHSGCHRKYHEKPTAECATVLQLPKSDAGIFGVNEVQKSLDQGNVVSTTQPLYRPGFTNLATM